MINTKTNKKLGIYIDYTNAYLMELIGKNIVSRNIEFESGKTDKEATRINKSDSTETKTEYHLQTAYYLEISEIIRNYNQVVLFGPADVKNNLYTQLEFDHDFDHIKIQNINTDKMTQNQIHDFVKEYYN
ncbi:MAG: hypothetical protein PHT07_22920 [Paludibacter sp.]|nr:hypothetical protein [Paludibacter sp.]